jgi:hypothetical protein
MLAPLWDRMVRLMNRIRLKIVGFAVLGFIAAGAYLCWHRTKTAMSGVGIRCRARYYRLKLIK